MGNKINASLATFGKYIFWTAVGAAAVAASDPAKLGKWGIPVLLISVIGAVCKSIATYAATQKD